MAKPLIEPENDLSGAATSAEPGAATSAESGAATSAEPGVACLLYTSDAADE